MVIAMLVVLIFIAFNILVMVSEQRRHHNEVESLLEEIRDAVRVTS